MPRCCPALPDEVLPNSKTVESVVFQVATSLGVADQFEFSNGSGNKAHGSPKLAHSYGTEAVPISGVPIDERDGIWDANF